jgi:glycosyltransferase involved in cell wall biosynthesis
VKAASIIQRAIPGVEFVLVGENIDSTFKSLVTAISSAGLIEHFHLLGRREDVAKILTAFDVLVSSSVGEGFPNVLGEAMACGVPCVVTDVGDSADIVGESGRVVCSGDMQSLAVNVVDLLLKPELRLSLGNIARRRVKSNFDIVHVVLQYQDLYTDVFEGKK